MGSGRLVEFPIEVLVEALRRTPTVAAAARLAGCSAPLIHSQARESGQLQDAMREQALRRERLLAAAILEHRGILSKVAEATGLESGTAVRYHIQRNPRLQAVFEEARERVVDVAEDNVFHAVEEGDLGYSWKLLQTLGKARGYTERREVEVGGTVRVEHTATPHLVALLNQLAESEPQAVEAAFEELPAEERGLLARALERGVAGPAPAGEPAQEAA